MEAIKYHSCLVPEKRRDNRVSVREVLREAGLRRTHARVAVLQALSRSNRPLTHAEVDERVSGEGFDRATVYRNLMHLTEAGLVHRSDVGGRVWRFELLRSDSPAAPGHAAEGHPHFVCNDCGTVQCLPECTVSLEGVRRGPKSLRRRKPLQIQIRGLCDACV